MPTEIHLDIPDLGLVKVVLPGVPARGDVIRYHAPDRELPDVVVVDRVWGWEQVVLRVRPVRPSAEDVLRWYCAFEDMLQALRGEV